MSQAGAGRRPLHPAVSPAWTISLPRAVPLISVPLRPAKRSPGAVRLVGASLGSIGAMVFSRITAEPQVMGGQPCVRGMRMPVATIVAMVAGGITVGEIIAEHPGLTPEDVREALQYARPA